MFKSIKIVNYKNEELLIDFFNSDPTGFNIRKIDGLGPVKADIATTKIVTSDGDIYNSARANGRNIVLTLGFIIKPDIGMNTIEDCRQKTYKYFPLKKKLKFIVTTDNRELYTYGYVESNEPDIWSKDETTQISIICPSPWFQSKGSNSVKITNVRPLFKFPFEVLEQDLEVKDLTDKTKEYGLERTLDGDDTQTDNYFFGNDIYDLYDNLATYGDIEFLRIENFKGQTYDFIRRIQPESQIINL